MVMDQENNSALLPYRILDLTEFGCMLGGRMLADAGADVIKIERPGGSSSRVAPYYKNIADPEKSLVWFAYNTNKRGITLDIRSPEGQELFKKLVQTADVVMDSFEAGFLDQLNLGYADLCKIKPDIILTSITPFGRQGPKSSYKASDLTIWASGGFLNDCGDPDRAPVWISFPQATLFGGAEGAIGTLTALLYRLESGEGQFVDVSMQEAAVSPNMNILPMWDVSGIEFHRMGAVSYVPSTGVKQPIYFKCRDGYIMILAIGGNDPYASSSERLVKWMAEADMAPEWLTGLNWWTEYNASVLTQQLADEVGKAIGKFTLTKTKDELYLEGAFDRQILIAPVSNTKDISEDIQLKARNYWINLPHPELGLSLPYCGPFIKMSETPLKYKFRAPLIGEHNREIFVRELGISETRFKSLEGRRII